MTRGLRRIHRLAWLVLAAALAVGYWLALGVRPPPETDPASTTVSTASGDSRP